MPYGNARQMRRVGEHRQEDLSGDGLSLTSNYGSNSLTKTIFTHLYDSALDAYSEKPFRVRDGAKLAALLTAGMGAVAYELAADAARGIEDVIFKESPM